MLGLEDILDKVESWVPGIGVLSLLACDICVLGAEAAVLGAGGR